MKKSLIALALSVLKPQVPEFEIKPAGIGYLKQHPSRRSGGRFQTAFFKRVLKQD